MKKLLAGLVLLAMLVSLAPAALAEETPSILVSSAEAAPGQEVSVTVSLENNPGIMAFVLGIGYDSDVLEKVSVTHEGLAGSWLIGDNAVWIGSADSEYDGRIMTITFKVKDDAPAGNSQVTITCSEGAIANSDEQTVDFSVVSGGVTVTGTENTDDSEKKPDATAKPTTAPGQTAGNAGNAGNAGTQTTAPAAEDDAALEQAVLETLMEITDGDGDFMAEETPIPASAAETGEEKPVTEPEPETEIVSGISGQSAKEEQGADIIIVVIIALAVVLVGLIVAVVVMLARKNPRASGKHYRNNTDRR